MPYSMDNPPEKIKGLPKHAKEIWIAAFNAALKEYDDEGKATATAWAAVKKSGYSQNEKGEWHKAEAITELWDAIKRLFAPLVGDESERAIKDASSWDGAASNYSDTEAYCKACLINLNDGDPANWTQANCKLPVKDPSGSYVKQGIHAAAVALAGGRTPLKAPPEEKAKAADKLISLYNQMDEQAPDSIYKVAGKEPPKRMLAYLPTQTHSLTITRDAQGTPRWLMIAASAVINKVGAIDSTTLFDNFIRHANESGEYPVLDFLHEGERVRFGVADWLRRDGALYLASGGFDDTELARGAVTGLESQSDYWGASIAYRVTEPPLMLISEGEIPVYQNGVNNFISIVPKRLAANLFTATLVAEEVRRMDKQAYDELVKLVGEERAKQFANQVDDANRTITDTGMVTRAEETKPTPEVPPVAPAPPAAPSAQTRQNAEPLIDVPAVTEPTIPDIVSKLNEINFKVEALERMFGELQKGYGDAQASSLRSTEDQKRATDTMTDLTTRLASVEEIKARWLAWVNDAPEYVKAEADKVYRARNQEPAPMTMAQLAEQNVSKLNRGPHMRRTQSG